MAPDEATSGTAVERDRDPALIQRRSGQTAVILRGDHDLATVAALTETVSRAISLDRADLLMDLSAVTFMDAGTVAVITRTHEFLVAHSRALVLQSPSPPARLVLELCGLEHLLDPQATGTPGVKSKSALGTWVPVPTTAATEPTKRGANSPASAPAERRVTEPFSVDAGGG